MHYVVQLLLGIFIFSWWVHLSGMVLLWGHWALLFLSMRYLHGQLWGAGWLYQGVCWLAKRFLNDDDLM